MKRDNKKVYMVARWFPIGDAPAWGCRARTHVMGTWFDLETAREKCREYNYNLRQHPHRPGEYSDHTYKFHVVGYQIRDAHQWNIEKLPA